MAELHAGQLQLAADLDPKQLVAHDLNGPASRPEHGPAAGGLQLECAVFPLRPFNNPFAQLGRYRPQFAAGDHHKVAPVPSATTVHLHKFVGGTMGVIPLKPGGDLRQSTRSPSRRRASSRCFFERVKLLSLDKQKIVVPEVFAGHVFDAEDALLLCHGVQPSARILSRAALVMKADRVRPRASAASSIASSRPASSERLALTARHASRTNRTSARASPAASAAFTSGSLRSFAIERGAGMGSASSAQSARASMALISASSTVSPMAVQPGQSGNTTP